MECWRCGSNLKDDASSCRRCGAALIRGEQPSPLSVALTLRPDLVAREPWAQQHLAGLDLGVAPRRYVNWAYLCAVLACVVSPIVFFAVGWHLTNKAEHAGEPDVASARRWLRIGTTCGFVVGAAVIWYSRTRG